MKVSDLKSGQLYQMQKNSGSRIDPLRPRNSFEVFIMKIWRTTVKWSLHSFADNSKHLYLYVGPRLDDWSYNGVFKHHYFLAGGREIIIDNKSIKHLVTFNGTI